MTQHTSGPWETSILSNGTQWQVCEKDGGDMIADLSETDNQEANARLIALAPDLLAACQALIDERASGDPRRESHAQANAKRLIAKARIE